MGTEKEWLSIPKAEYVVNNSAEMTMHFLTLHESTVSCTEAGTESYYQFDDTSVYAGMYNMDKEPISQLELLPALGHTEVVDEAVDATCTKDGLTEGSHCSVCGEVIVAQEVISAGHVVENGICTRCKAYGTHGDNLTWEFNETDGTFTISGGGVMQDIGSYYSSWSDYVEQITTVVVHEGVTSIGRHAFSDCVNLKTISLPGSVLCIGEGAFVGCKNLEIVVLSEGLEEIGDQAFTGCDSLKKIQLPETLTTIRTAAFSNCDSLVEIKIPDSVTELEQGIFQASGISCVELPENLTVIPTCIFYECKNLTEIQWPSAVTCIDASAFAHSGLSKITIPASITAIDDTAFAGSALKKVTFLGDPPSFGDEVFDNVIADVYYYDNGKWNSNNMRQYDGVLNWIPMSNPVTSGICGDNLTWTYCDGTLTVSGTGAMYDYSQDQTNPAPWAIWGGDIKALVVEEGITEIGDFAFTSCSVIENASFPSTLTRVGEYAFYKLTRPDGNMYHRAFCSEINQTVRQWSQITFEADNEGFPGGDSTKFVHYAPITASGKYGDKVFWELNENGTMEFFGSGDMDEFGATGSWLYDLRASTIIISEGITNIGMNAFETYGEDPLCVSLETVRVASTVKRVEEMAFAGCQALKIITFTGDAPTFGENCFRDVTATVCYPAGNVTWTDAVMQDYEGSITWMGYDDPSEPIEPTEPPESTDPIEPTDPVEPVFPMTGTVTTLLNVRSAPSQSADIVDKLQPGTKVEILRIETINDVEWGLIDTGWIMMHYVDLGNGSDTPDNSCGKDLVWAFDVETGVLSISGTGPMTDFTMDGSRYLAKPTDTPWLSLEDDVRKIIIEEGVTTIGTGAFADFDNLTSVSLPDSLNSIGDYAFHADELLTDLNIPDSVTYLGDYSLCVCVNLPAVTLPSGITEIGESALDQCLALETLSIPASVSSICGRGLAYCTNLKEVVFEGSAPAFDDTAFHGSAFTAYYRFEDPSWTASVQQNYGGTITWVPYSTEHVHEYDDEHVCECGAIGGICGDNLIWEFDEETSTLTISGTGDMYDFADAGSPWYSRNGKITHVVIHEDATSIGSYAFISCGMKDILIPDSVTRIGECAFASSQIKSITIPDGVAEIEEYTFSMSALTSIVLPEQLKVIGENAFAETELTAITLPNSLEKIGAEAFWDTKLTAVTIPENVSDIGTGAFAWCEALVSFSVAENNIQFASQEDVLFDKDGITLIQYPAKKAQEAYVVPEGTSIIGAYAFSSAKALQGITLPDSITAFMSCAFISCSGLTEIEIPQNVESFGSGVFQNCIGLKTVTFTGDAPDFAGNWINGNIALTANYPKSNATWTSDVMQNYGGTITWVPYGAVKNRITVDVADLDGQTSVWIDGVEYALQTDGRASYIDLPGGNARTMVSYTYRVDDASDIHTQYPVSMKVWMLENEDGIYTATRAEELDNILQYSGSSIRVTGKQGIRMITAIEKADKNSLVTDGLAGYTLKEYGTVVAWASRMDGGNPLVLGQSYAMSNYAYKKGIADPVFADDGNLTQYTNVLVGFSLEQCKNDLAMRPYMILEDANGEEITLYGGIVQRSIGYIALQNRDTFAEGTEAHDYIMGIIHYVYGDDI